MSLQIQINNDNIRSLVKNYCKYKYSRAKFFLNYLPLDEDGNLMPIGQWDVSQVTDMSDLFNTNFSPKINKYSEECKDNELLVKVIQNFNEPLDDWDVSHVKTMKGMFFGCINFNQPLNKWIVNEVEDMSYMFCFCMKFNQPLNKWNVSKVKSMNMMFFNCLSFNQPINNWNVRKVMEFNNMYSNCPIRNDYEASSKNFEKYQRILWLHAVGDDETIIRNNALGNIPYDVKRYIATNLGGKKSRRRRKKSKRKTRKTRRQGKKLKKY